MTFCRDCGGELKEYWNIVCPHCTAKLPPNDQPGIDASITVGESSLVAEGAIIQNIIQYNPDDIATALESRIDRMVVEKLALARDTGQSIPVEITTEHSKASLDAIDKSQQLEIHDAVIDPWTDVVNGRNAKLSAKTKAARKHYQAALEKFRINGDRHAEALVLSELGSVSKWEGSTKTIPYNEKQFSEAEELWQQSMDIFVEMGDRNGEANLLSLFASIPYWRALQESARWRYNGHEIDFEYTRKYFNPDFDFVYTHLAEAEQLYQKCMSIFQEIDNQQGADDAQRQLESVKELLDSVKEQLVSLDSVKEQLVSKGFRVSIQIVCGLFLLWLWLNMA